MVDRLAVIREFLLASGTPLLTALGGNYVAVDRVPKGFDNSHPGIVIRQETGSAHPTGADQRDVIVCTCYGGSAESSDARAIFRALYDRLLLPGQTLLASGSLKQAFFLSDFAGPDDPITGWPNHIGRWEVVVET